MATDGQLIRQIQQGESDAFNQLFHKYQKDIYSVCLSILKNPQDAEEVVSDTFIHAYLKFDQLKNPENFFAWLRKIAQNRSRDFLRSKREEAIPFVYATEQPRRQSAPDESLLKRELMDAVMEAIELLPHKDREVLRAHIDGLSHVEISEKLGISYEASRSRLYRARKNIAEYAKDLLNAIFGKPLMLPFKKIISGGIMAMKVGTKAKIIIGVIGILVVGFIGFQIVTHQSDVESTKVAVQQQTAKSEVRQIPVSKMDSRLNKREAGDKQTKTPTLDVNNQNVLASTEETRTISNPESIVLDEDEVPVPTRTPKKQWKIFEQYTPEEARQKASELAVEIEYMLNQRIELEDEAWHLSQALADKPAEAKAMTPYIRELQFKSIAIFKSVSHLAGIYTILSGDKAAIEPGGWILELMNAAKISPKTSFVTSGELPLPAK